ncbi:MAG: YcxB family protein [Lachnospiraceae bacterium]|nr:YcxB family protein [Lachnospiraceae bacterium]
MEEYRFRQEVKASDYFRLIMTGTYRSAVGVVHIVFTVAMAALAFRFLGRTNAFYDGLIVFGLILFPVLHPLAIYGQSVKQTERLPRDLELVFDDRGVHACSGGKTEDLPWSRVTRVIKHRHMLILYTDTERGYMLTDRVLGDRKDEFYMYLKKKLGRA